MTGVWGRWLWRLDAGGCGSSNRKAGSLGHHQNASRFFLLLDFFLDSVFVVLGFFDGGGIHSALSLPSPIPMLSIFWSISAFVPTATTWEMCFSHPFTLHIAPGTSSSKGDKIFDTVTKECRFSSGRRIRQWVTV